MELTKALIDDVLAGDTRAARSLLRAIIPIIQTRVGRTLLRHRDPAQRRDARQEVEDLTQHVLLALFVDRGHALRQWDPTRGLSLVNYVGIRAEWETLDVLRSGRQSPWADEPMAAEELDGEAESARVPERIVASRELLGAIIDDVCSRLSEQGTQMFQWIIVDERSVEEICGMTGMKPGSVYVWKTRIVQMLRQAADRLVLGSDGAPPSRR